MEKLEPLQEAILLFLYAAQVTNYRNGTLSKDELLLLTSIRDEWTPTDVAALSELVKMCPEKVLPNKEQMHE